MLKACIDSILASVYTDYELIIVDDASTDDTRTMIKQYDCKYIRLDRNGGVANARNVGARNAASKKLLFIDSDVIINEDSLGNVIKNFKKHKVDLMCGYKKPTNLAEGFGSDFVMHRKTFTYGKISTDTEYIISSFIETAFFAIKKDLFERSGGFNVTYTGSSLEDHELGHRLYRDHKIYFFKNLGILHHYESIGGYIKKILPRSYNFGLLWLRDRRLEKTGLGTYGELKKAILVVFLFLSLVISFFVPLLFISIILLLLFIAVRLPFYRHLYRQSKIWSILGMPIDMLLYSLNGIGIGCAFISYAIGPFKRIFAFGIDVLRVLMSKTPSNIILFTTAKCDIARCKHCFYWKEIDDARNRKELTLKEIQRISRNLDNVYYLSLTGGEPTLREDLADICETFYKNNHLKIISYNTNGFLPYKVKENVEKILKRCKGTILTVAVSLDGPKDIHNKIRGNALSYDNAVKTLELLSPMREIYPNLELLYRSTFSMHSKDSFIELEKDLERLKCWHSWTYARGNTRDKAARPSDYKMYKIFRKEYFKSKAVKPKMFFFKNPIINMIKWCAGMTHMDINVRTLKEQRQIIPCKSGKHTIVIRDNGDIEPCEMLGMKMGNIREFNYDIKILLSSEQAHHILKHIKDKKCYCTHECGLYASVLFNIKMYPKMLKNLFYYISYRFKK